MSTLNGLIDEIDAEIDSSEAEETDAGLMRAKSIFRDVDFSGSRVVNFLLSAVEMVFAALLFLPLVLITFDRSDTPSNRKSFPVILFVSH